MDGIIAVSAGAGGHAGQLNPFAFLHELRSIFTGTLVLSGGMSSGAHIAAARAAGADLAYLGTRFIATRESMAPEEYKQMVLAAEAKDIVYTDAISGVKGNFLKPSLAAAGLDPDNLPPFDAELRLGEGKRRRWKNIWSAGHGVGAIRDIPTTAALCVRLEAEYRATIHALAEPA